jgi:serine/threonine protein kinase
VRDRYVGANFALKVLGDDASEPEMAALVREAVALSGLEGLGVPRVQRFGRLPGTGRPFMVRELVEGESLLDLIERGRDLPRALDAIARAADQLTEVHRAGLFHGDVKPANVIVAADGAATLVDLGSRRRGGGWCDAGGAHPEVRRARALRGAPTHRACRGVRAGGDAREALEKASGPPLAPSERLALEEVSARATAAEPERRFPPSTSSQSRSGSRRVCGSAPSIPTTRWGGRWSASTPRPGGCSTRRARSPRGRSSACGAPSTRGRTVLVRRLAWSLGIEGRPLVWLDEAVARSPEAIRAELEAFESPRGLVLLIDDADDLSSEAEAEARRALAAGARLVVVGGSSLGAGIDFVVPPLEPRAAADLIRRAVPSLTENLVERAHPAGPRSSWHAAPPRASESRAPRSPPRPTSSGHWRGARTTCPTP